MAVSDENSFDANTGHEIYLIWQDAIPIVEWPMAVSGENCFDTMQVFTSSCEASLHCA